MRYSTLFFGIIAVFMIISGCVLPFPKSLPKSSKPPRVHINFDYTPPSKAPPGSANVTFALVSTWIETPVPLFRTFASNMTKDFEEILTARGFGVRGPFTTFDDMTYTDKEGSDLTLTANVEFSTDTSQMILSVMNIPSGAVTVKCHVNLIASESITKEKLWTKSVAIKPFTVNLQSRTAYTGRVHLATLLKHENIFYSDVGHALNAQYTEIMNKIYGYLDPKEMAVVAQSARDLRKKKVFR